MFGLGNELPTEWFLQDIRDSYPVRQALIEQVGRPYPWYRHSLLNDGLGAP